MQTRQRRRPDNEADHLKGRMAEALVEGMFMRAGYFVSRIGRENHVPRLLKIGRDEFLPDFVVRKPVRRPGSDRPLHHLIPIEVKYRRDVPAFLRHDGPEFFERTTPYWRDLCLIFVTDNPRPGQSCFQVVELLEGKGRTAQNLEAVPGLDIYASTVREYERLVKRLFPLLDACA